MGGVTSPAGVRRLARGVEGGEVLLVHSLALALPHPSYSPPRLPRGCSLWYYSRRRLTSPATLRRPVTPSSTLPPSSTHGVSRPVPRPCVARISRRPLLLPAATSVLRGWPPLFRTPPSASRPLIVSPPTRSVHMLHVLGRALSPQGPLPQQAQVAALKVAPLSRRTPATPTPLARP